MERAPLSLEFGPGFVAGRVDSATEQLAFLPGHELDVCVAAADLGARRVLGRLPGNHLHAGAIAGSRVRKKIYVAAVASIWAFPIEGGEPELVVRLPELPAASKAEMHEAFGVNEHNEHWVPRIKGQPSCYWAFELDEAEDRLFALCGQDGALDHLLEIDLGSGVVSSQTRLPGFCGGIELDVSRKKIVLPRLKGGPCVLDFAGHPLARWREPTSWDAAFRPSDGAVVLANEADDLWLWDWERNASTRVAEDASAPTCASDGTVFFMRTSAELWMVEPAASPQLIVRALENEGGTEFDRKHAWVKRPRLSRDGRFLLVQLTSIRKTGRAHDAVVVDRIDRRVHQFPGFFSYVTSWF
ncbi:MAG: hypothetical protein U0228_37105 [Myxococcaceae bacterium]